MAKKITNWREETVNGQFRDFQAKYDHIPTHDDQFTLYAAHLLLRDFQLSTEELESGLTDGSLDGGVDAIYTFYRGELVESDSEFFQQNESKRSRQTEGTIECYLFQTKESSGWKESALNTLFSYIDEIFEVENPTQTNADNLILNPQVTEQAQTFLRFLDSTRNSYPSVKFTVIYSTLASENQIRDGLKKVGKRLERHIGERNFLPPDTEIECRLVGIETLYELGKAPRTEPLNLTLGQSVLLGNSSYIALPSLKEYLNFVKELDTGALRPQLFMSNVRDFEGQNVVNKEIRKTLESPTDSGDFWWQNNGITILCTKSTLHSGKITLEHPLIVNGLQTTHVLYDVEKSGKLHSSRLEQQILVKIIESADEKVRDEVIAGTNRQTRVANTSLRATDELQVDLENYFKAKGLFYERRKNYFKNLGEPAGRIISMNLLGQAMMTLNNVEPDIARARPTSALDKNFDKVFDSEIPREAYLRAAQLMLSINRFLRTKEAKDLIRSTTNMRFYLLLGSTLHWLGCSDISNLHYKHRHSELPEEFDSATLLPIAEKVMDLFEEYSSTHPGVEMDQIAKSSDFRMWFCKQASRFLLK